ncbi:MAG: group I intron-associated PD-(D/E)XK endonuclease [bacterium]|nr:group I intron-associated PD-(D/E)XK endonuclease [bacterium]MDZ4206019.1 group I intron-associated PD-(D/E)XK endonuclease [Patescibacteria group bacterium]
MRLTQRKGDVAVAQAIARFTKLGYDVSLPITESAAYDLIIDDDGKLRKVQVRYCGAGDVDLRRIHSNSKGYVVKKTKNGAYDWLYIFYPDKGEYLIRECLVGRRSIKPTEKHRL